MTDTTAIEWTATRLLDGTVLPGYTFNPWEGCQKVGPGCDHCYAEARNVRFTGGVNWGPHAPRRRTSAANWRKPIKWNLDAEYSGIRRNVFCASLADVFDNHATILPGWRIELGQMILHTPNLNWMLLTKRIGNAAAMLAAMFPDGPPPNLWIGATVVNQVEADRDIPKLLSLPVAVRFLSMEPLLGPVDIEPYLHHDDCMASRRYCRTIGGDPLCHCGERATLDHRINWVICGGESGPGARPMHPDWARSLRDQCQAAGVAFFFKQWGEWAPALHDTDDGNVLRQTEYTGSFDPWKTSVYDDRADTGLNWRKLGKHRSGRLLDGRAWDQMPGVEE